jgi:hypothetical protein
MQVCLVAVLLRADGFERYRCDRERTLGLAMGNLQKVLKCAGGAEEVGVGRGGARPGSSARCYSAARERVGAPVQTPTVCRRGWAPLWLNEPWLLFLPVTLQACQPPLCCPRGATLLRNARPPPGNDDIITLRAQDDSDTLMLTFESTKSERLAGVPVGGEAGHAVYKRVGGQVGSA